MKARHLVLTALEETWPSVDNPVLFLGEWCKIFNRKETWGKYDAETVLYHWDDREKLYNDYLYLSNLYEVILKELAKKLNEVHNLNHSIRYWRILVGPWLGYFIQISFDRYEMFRLANDKFALLDVIVDKQLIHKITPFDMNEFNNFIDTDLWNFAIYSFIISSNFVKKTNYISIEVNEELLNKVEVRVNWKTKFKAILIYIFSFLTESFLISPKIFVFASYLPKFTSLLFQFTIGQIPGIWKVLLHSAHRIKKKPRNWVLSINQPSEFEKILLNMIPIQIPIAYIEAYPTIKDEIKNSGLPKNPNVIFTSNAHNANDKFKLYTAENVEESSKLVIGQHGGHFGTGKWSFLEDHELSIADRYLSWGWVKNNETNVYPNYSITITGKKDIVWQRDGSVLLVTCALPRYSYWMYSSICSSQWLDYLNEQFLFVDTLAKSIQENLLVRLYSHDYDWNQKERWNQKFPEIQLDEGRVSMEKLQTNSRLYVSTYNATTFLESMSRNMPTIIYWNPNHWELRDSAIPYFDLLKKVGIFFESPELAAKKVNEIWDDIESWWYSFEVQNAKNIFCNQFARHDDNPIAKLKNALDLKH
ncbi:LIC12162 family transferase [Leptospira levettii]|uniref:LIC12162 family protein n=1 Tax=Leptospira levettii TaxID=2023178 RepID=A0AAW5V3N7_9LEPT|nr:LIC12162 family protein [Leptospira levettii]MCW7466202.1 LIC12162 family protein [Leptospira levettii]MCW7512273.1 LIC12162 family protein [Leptospira levettii]MCW7516281.1 LIC12162 family protein [Leptospira levettii]